MKSCVYSFLILLASMSMTTCGGGGSTSGTPITGSPSGGNLATPKIVWTETKVSSTTGSDNDGDSSETPLGLAVVDDGHDGTYVLWEHRYPIGIYVQHLDQSGHPMWPAPGLSVTSTWTGWQASPRAVSDGNGGVIVVWVDGRNGWCSPSFMAECDVYGQRMDASGNRVWGPDGKPISTASGNQGLQNLNALSDNAGGAYIVYADGRLSSTSGGGTGGTTLYLQRVDGSGDGVWTSDGIRIGQDPEAGDAGVIGNVKILKDGSGGILATWYFTSYKQLTSAKSVRAQRVSAAGQILWSSGGVVVPGVSASDSNGTGSQTLDAVSDGAGGLIITASWSLPGTSVPIIFAQKVDSTGAARWGSNAARVSISSAIELNPTALSDGQGGAYISWQDCQDWGSCDISMAHMNSSGQRAWGPISIAQLPNQQLAPVMVSNRVAGPLVMWTDCRAYGDANGCYANQDIYAQSVGATGSMLYTTNGAPLTTSSGNQGQQYYVYTPLPAMAYVQLQSGDVVMAWPDGRSGTCFSANPDSTCAVYVERFTP